MKAQGVGPAAIAKALKIGRASAHRPPALLPPPGPIRRMLSRDLLPMRMRRAARDWKAATGCGGRRFEDVTDRVDR
jgi:hypothetical protein